MPLRPNAPTDDPDDEQIDDDSVVQPPDDGVPPIVQPPVVAVAPPPIDTTEDDEEFGRLTPREKALVQKARSQEKTKLYGQVQTLRTEIATLKRTPLPPSVLPSSNGGGSSRQQRDAEIVSLQNSLNTLNDAIRQRDERDRAREVRDYRREKIADLRRVGTPFIEGMVNGDNEEMIDASISASIAEAQYQEVQFRQKFGIGDDNVVPAGGRRPSTVVIRQPAPRQPDGVPTVVGAGSGGDSSNVLTIAELNAMTSDTAIRNGTFAANRDRIHQALRTGAVQRR